MLSSAISKVLYLSSGMDSSKTDLGITSSPEGAKRERRPSAYSAIDYLAPPPDPSLLSPASLIGCNSRRRNSYAATTETTSPDLLHLMTSGAVASMSYGSSSHFLDPRAAASASFKRRLPPTPLDISSSCDPAHLGSQITLMPGEISPRRYVGKASQIQRNHIKLRSSSPRVLPPTPTVEENEFPLDRRKSASTRRRLPQGSYFYLIYILFLNLSIFLEPELASSSNTSSGGLGPARPQISLDPEWASGTMSRTMYRTMSSRSSRGIGISTVYAFDILSQLR